jgi:hypothetical protein
MMTGVLDGGGRAWKVDDSCDGMEEGGRGDRGRVDWKRVRRGLEPRLARLRVVRKMGSFCVEMVKGIWQERKRFVCSRRTYNLSTGLRPR